MDPITMIVAALAAGASAGIGNAATQGVKDAYGALKALVARRFGRDARAQATLAEHETDPETYEKPLAKQLAMVSADQDQEIVRAAERLLRLSGSSGSTYHLQLNGGKVGIIGDHGHIETMS